MTLHRSKPRNMALGRVGMSVILVAIFAASLGAGLFYAQSIGSTTTRSNGGGSSTLIQTQTSASTMSVTGTDSEVSSSSSSSWSSSYSSSTGSINGLIRLGYLNADYISARGTDYPLNNSGGSPTTLNIPQSESSGYLSFAFSGTISSASQVFAYSKSCTRSLSNGANPSCGSKTTLSLSYEQNSQGQYAATTSNVNLPCGSLQMYQGTMIPTQFIEASIGVNTTVVPYTYTYVLYAAC